jgi:hypothetical protein
MMKHEYWVTVWLKDTTVRVRVMCDPDNINNYAAAVHTNQFEGAGWKEVAPDKVDAVSRVIVARRDWEVDRESRRAND